MSATIEKMVLDYQTLKYRGIYGPNEYGTDPDLFFNGLIFCTAETSNQYTQIDTHVLHKTGSGEGNGPAELIFKFTPLFLIRKGEPNQEYPCERLDANHVLVRNVKFRKIETIKVLDGHLDDVPEWTDLPDDHVTFWAGDITLDLKYQEIYGENGKYYKLVSATRNGTEITSDYFDDDTAATCWNNLFGKEVYPNPSTGTEVGRFIRYASSTVGLTETYYNDVAFNQYAIGHLTTYEPGEKQRCECGGYPDGDASAPPTTDIAYIFDFSGVLHYDIDGLNQGYRIHTDIFVLTDPTNYTGDLKTFFESSAPMLEEVYDEHMVVAVDEEHVTYVNFDNTGSYPRGFLKKLFYEQQIPTEQRINYTDQALEDNILMSDTLIIPLSDDYITPMEFYEGTNDAVEVEFSSKLVAKTAADKTDIPTYFWVESLKNWCYYDMTTVNDACNIAMLKVWNGKDNWQFLDNLLESAKLRYIPRAEYSKLLYEYQNTSTTAVRKAEIKEILSDFADHTLSQFLVYPCNLDKFKTISIDRIYHGAKANYAGNKDKGFLDYLYDATVGNVINAAVGTWYIISSPFSTHKFDKFKKGLGTIATGVLNAAAGTAMIFLALTPDLISKLVYSGLDKFINSFSNISAFWRIDHYQTLFASCRYVILPYDNKYSNNDEVTFQTIRNHDRWDNVEGGIMTRERIIAYLSINTTIGSPFIARSSTGELMLATAFTYSGPVREKYDSSTDLLKKPGIIADDIKLSNELLQKTLGNGYDKTIKDWLNFMGNTPDESLTPTVNVNNATAISKSVAELTNTNQTAEASMLLTANRSKVSSDVENVVINTLKKW